MGYHYGKNLNLTSLFCPFAIITLWQKPQPLPLFCPTLSFGPICHGNAGPEAKNIPFWVNAQLGRKVVKISQISQRKWPFRQGLSKMVFLTSLGRSAGGQILCYFVLAATFVLACQKC